MFKSKHLRKLTPEDLAKGRAVRAKNLTIKQRKFVSKVVNGESPKQAVLDVYSGKKENSSTRANELLKKPKIQREIDRALENAGFSTDYATSKMKKLMEAGEANLDATRPGDMIRMLELWMKAKGIIGGTNRIDPAEQQYKDKVKKMEFTELRKQISDMDKRQKTLLAKIDGRTEEGEVVK
jgi:phage terminase small subunit